ncbi:hypothetical protein L2E82_39570 [Cichorium intybus]|uniref:Uncharacterized protein n=1 Tax=Cichorium intybus TaxID=13427 RepID=A0ACB9AIF0_CICIN|nr:hypothetical protein L2E82_39570 [Cichorium intybus]
MCATRVRVSQQETEGLDETPEYGSRAVHSGCDDRRQSGRTTFGPILADTNHVSPILVQLKLTDTSICITGSGSIAFMQMSEQQVTYIIMTEQQVHAWSMDANQYVADEDENTYSCRVSGSLLLEEIVISCGIEVVYAILNAAKQRLDESQQQRVKGSAEWWRIVLEHFHCVLMLIFLWSTRKVSIEEGDSGDREFGPCCRAHMEIFSRGEHVNIHCQ